MRALIPEAHKRYNPSEVEECARAAVQLQMIGIAEQWSSGSGSLLEALGECAHQLPSKATCSLTLCQSPNLRIQPQKAIKD